ncbi:MAG: hypothetical protein ACRBBP_00100 [Bdellovibrionales bacterium]
MKILFIFTSVITLLLSGQSFAETYTYQKDVSFGKVQHQANQAVKKSAEVFYKEISDQYKKACIDGNKSIKDKSQIKYAVKGNVFNCSLNIEKLLKGKKQNLISTKVKVPAGEYQGVHVSTIMASKLSVDLQPIYENHKVNLLDKKSTQTLSEKRAIEKNISIQHNPKKGSLYSSTCAQLPGIKAATKLTPIMLYLKKHIWWFIWAKAVVWVRADLGHYRYNTARICAANKATVSQKDLESVIEGDFPDLKTTASEIYISSPKISSLKYKGAKIQKVRVEGANIITRLALFLFRKKADLYISQLVKATNQEISKNLGKRISATNSSLKSGEIWKDLANSTLLPPQIQLVKNINKAIKVSVENSTHQSLEVNEHIIKEKCNDLVKNLEDNQSLKVLGDECGNIIQKVEVIPFDQNKISKTKGCYKYKYMIDAHAKLANKSKKNNWWKKGCSISTTIRVTPNAQYEETYACIDKGIRNGWSEQAYADNCSRVFLQERFSIDTSSVLELLNTQQIPTGLPRQIKNIIIDSVRFL